VAHIDLPRRSHFPELTGSEIAAAVGISRMLRNQPRVSGLR
jgi:hypothetical protein